MNTIGKDKQCQVTVNNGYTFLTDSLEINNDTLFYKLANSDSLQLVPFNQITSVYYKDHWAGLFEGGLMGIALGASIGYVIAPDIRGANGSLKRSPMVGACCLGSLGFIGGATYGGINGVLKMYEINVDTLKQDTLKINDLFNPDRELY